MHIIDSQHTPIQYLDLHFHNILTVALMHLIICNSIFMSAVSPQSAAAAPSPVLGNLPPGDGMPGGPMPPGFFQVSLGAASLITGVHQTSVSERELPFLYS